MYLCACVVGGDLEHVYDDADTLQRFLDENFGIPGSDLVACRPQDYTPELVDFLPGVYNPEARRWALKIHSLWLLLARQVTDCVKEEPNQLPCYLSNILSLCLESASEKCTIGTATGSSGTSSVLCVHICFFMCRHCASSSLLLLLMEKCTILACLFLQEQALEVLIILMPFDRNKFVLSF